MKPWPHFPEWAGDPGWRAIPVAARISPDGQEVIEPAKGLEERTMHTRTRLAVMALLLAAPLGGFALAAPRRAEGRVR